MVARKLFGKTAVLVRGCRGIMDQKLPRTAALPANLQKNIPACQEIPVTGPFAGKAVLFISTYPSSQPVIHRHIADCQSGRIPQESCQIYAHIAILPVNSRQRALPGAGIPQRHRAVLRTGPHGFRDTFSTKNAV